MTSIIDEANGLLNTAVNGAAAAFIGLAGSLPPMFTLVSVFCKLLGTGMIVHALLKLKNIRNKQNPSEMIFLLKSHGDHRALRVEAIQAQIDFSHKAPYILPLAE